ncbi:MAG: CRISPR-associated helicase Cas3' [Planktothrix sp.]|uniref:CRISPR-associated helicase Cas3' n=1 Tax=Planktothrix sp. TaxID=3088171 RepID=UPI0038D48812
MFARISENGDQQLLIDHLQGVAAKTRDKLPDFLKEMGYYAGLLHDLGKAKPLWQKYLLGEESRVNHSFEGARAAIELSGNKNHVIAHVIRGHHTGLKDLLRSDTFDTESTQWQSCLNLILPDLRFIPHLEIEDIFKQELAIRILFSALVDSDRLDAQLFELKCQSPHEEGLVYSKTNLCFNPVGFSKSESQLNRIRKQFRDSICQFITSDQSLYRLVGACGIGKTLTSLEFAIEHCNYHGMNGIIYVAPFKSILDQSAEVYRQQLGDDIVLEHHSDFVPKPGDEKSYKLSSQRWDKPVVLTTAVQFYESIFNNKPAQCRKLASLINRVILIDEYHTAPPQFIAPIADVLQNLVEDYGCTIVLMSATAPKLKTFGLNAVDMVAVEDLQPQFQALSRCNYQFIEGMDWEAIASYPGQKLVIVNTTKTASNAFQIFNTLQPGQWLHLSSRMCVAHRKSVIQQVKTGQFNCISTQIVEAGIDIDYPVIFTEECPLDALIQRGGRCNREGLLPSGNVFVIPCDQFPDPKYKSLAKSTSKDLKKYGLNADNLLKLLGWFFADKFNQQLNEIQNLRKDLKFESVAKKFKMIDDDHESVVCRWKDGSKLIDALMNKPQLSSFEWKQLQLYTATVSQKAENLIRTYDNGMKVWGGDYDDHVGLR